MNRSVLSQSIMSRSIVGPQHHVLNKKKVSGADIQRILSANNPGVSKLQIQKQLQSLMRRVKYHQNSHPDIDKELMENLFWYANNLAVPGTDHLDRCVFQAEMMTAFGMKCLIIVNRIYDVIRDREPQMLVDQYMELLSYFFTNEILNKADYTFKLYDIDSDGQITYAEVNRHFTNAKNQFSEQDDETVAENQRELLEILMAMFDDEGHGYVELTRYREVMEAKPELLECLGNCLPNDYSLRKFREQIISPKKFNVIQVYEQTKDRRHVLLQEAPELQKKQLKGLYPIKIVFPGSHELEDEIINTVFNK